MSKSYRTGLFLSGLSLSAMGFLAIAALPASAADTSASVSVSDDAVSKDTPMLRYLREKAHANLTGIAPVQVDKNTAIPCLAFDIGGHRNTGCLLGNHHFMIGVVIDDEGHNVTLDALATEEMRLANAMKQAGALVEQSRQQAAGAMAVEAATPALPDVSSAAKASTSAQLQSGPNAKPGEDIRWLTSQFKGDELDHDIAASAFFRIGADNLPTVVLIANPDCPFCHAAWSQLQPYVASGKIAVDVILAKPDTLRDGIALLSNPSVDKAWMAGQGSADDVSISGNQTPGSPAWKTASEYLKANGAIADKYIAMFSAPGKAGLPVILYASGGRSYGREGVSSPADMNSFLSGIPAVAKASPAPASSAK